MNKQPVLALLSLLFVASVTSFPLNEPTLEGLSTESSHENEYIISEDFSDFDDSNNKIEDFVLGSPSPQITTTGFCYQKCKSDAPASCRNVTPNSLKKMAKGERNYCRMVCAAYNSKC